MKITIGNVELAQFTPADTRALYDIRNHGSVRSFMSNSAPLEYDRHAAWTQKNLIDGRGFLLLLVRVAGADPVGFTLLQRKDADTAEIGVIFREATQHPVLPFVATVATLHLAFCHLDLARLVSYVTPTNDRAMSLNRALGMSEIESDKPGELKMHMRRADCLANPHYVKVFNRMKDHLTVTGLGPDTW